MCFLLYKQKTANELRISDWSSDLCSSDLLSDTVPDGRYLAIVEDYELTKAKASGNDMFVVWLRIREGPSSGSVIIDRLTTTGKGLFKIVGFLNGLGAPTPKRRLAINPEAWKNKKIRKSTRLNSSH